MKKLALFAGLMLATAAMPAFANTDPNNPGNPERSTMDHGTPSVNEAITGSDNGAMAQKWFQRVDTNGDNKVTPAENDAGAASKFAEIDTNKDGVITIDEFRAYKAHEGHGAEKLADAKFAELDADRDGKVIPAEYAAAATAMFMDADTDRDGTLSLDEVKAQKLREHDRLVKESRGQE